MFIGLEIQGKTCTIACVVDAHGEFVALDVERNTYHGKCAAYRGKDIACHFRRMGGGGEGFRLGAVLVQRDVLQSVVGIGTCWAGSVVCHRIGHKIGIHQARHTCREAGHTHCEGHGARGFHGFTHYLVGVGSPLRVRGRDCLCMHACGKANKQQR